MNKELLKAKGVALLERNRKAADAGDVAELKALEGEIAAWRREVKSFKDQQRLRDELGSDLAPSSQGKSTDLWARVKSAGFDPNLTAQGQRVSVGHVGAKALMADGTDANIAGLELSGYGRDQRFAYQSFPSVSLGNATSVAGLEQSARALATPSGMDVAIAGSTAKPESTVGLERTTYDAVMIATVTEAIPNSLWNLPAVHDFVRDELGYAVGLGIDSYLVTTLTGASGTDTITQGTYHLHEVYRRAIAQARANGHSPNLLIAHPNDALALDVIRDATDNFYGAGPHQSGTAAIWGVPIVESTTVTEGSPVLVDTRRFGKVFFGELQFATNPYSDGTIDLFGTNQAKARLETPMLVAVQQPLAIVEITLN